MYVSRSSRLRFVAAGTIVAVVVALASIVAPAAQAAAATSTAWNSGAFNLDRPNLVRESDIALGSPNTTPQSSVPLGNGSLGVAVWAAGGFTAQLNRSDTLPNRLSPGQVTIPGLSAITNAANFAAHLDLYNGVLTETGGGLTAQIYVRADADMLVVDVTGADPNSTQTAQVGLWSPRNPAAAASGAVGTLAETWADSSPGGTGATYGSLAAVTAGGRNVSASVVDGRTVRVAFNPNSDGSFRVLIGAPTWTGGNPATTATELFGSSATASSASLQVASVSWWNTFWSTTDLMKLTSADGSGEYMENLRTFYLYQEAGLNRGSGNVPGSQAGVADMYSYSQDSHDWVPSDVWWWNARMQVDANMTAGATALNTRWFNLYTSNLAPIQAWTSAKMPGTTGSCVPETMRFNGNGYYGDGSSSNNDSCDKTTSPSYNSQTISTGAEVALAMWRQYQTTGSTSFLSGAYPSMKAAAQFLLSYATVGGDGKLHETANAHETQWAVSDPVTDVDAMKALFPVVRSAAQILGLDTAFQAQLTTAIGETRDWPRTDAATHTQALTASADAGGQDVMAYSANPAAAQHNSENLDLEATYPYGLIGDNSGTLTDLEKRSYTNRVYRNDADWDYDSLYAARLGLSSEVAADLIATTEKYQLLPSGMASLFGQANSNEPYNEQAGVVAATLDEALAQDYDGLLRVAPAWPSTWDVDGQVSIQNNSKVDVQVRNGVPSTVVLEAGANAAMPVRSPWPGQAVQVLDATGGTTAVSSTTAATFTILTTAGHDYLIEQTSAPFTNLPYAQPTGAPATAAKHLGLVSIGLGGGGAPEGPYGGTAAAVPGTVQAENYDTGGQGVGYTVSSVNGNGTAYRADGVDLETTSDTGGGDDLGWTSGGQWFRYTVTVATAGTYTLGLRVAAPGAVTDALHLANATGTNLSGNVNIPSTGGWQTWGTVAATVTLPAGRQVLTLDEDNGGWNVNALQFTSTGSAEGPYGGSAAVVPGTVQAENYDTGGSGIAYTVTSVNGNGTAYRADGVDLETTSDTGGGDDLGWTSSGQWFRYTINAATAGTYTVGLRVAAPGAVTDALHLANAAGANLSGNINVPATGGWQTFATVTATVTLPAGPQVLTLDEDNGGWNANWWQFASSGGGTASLSASPASVTFGGQNVGSTGAAQTVTIHNSGTAAASVTSIGTSGDFAQTNTCGTSIAAAGSCTVSVTFTPTASGTRTGTLTVGSSATNSPTTVALTGTGSSGALNLAAGKATTESSHTDVYASSNVTDGNQGTYWESANNAFPQWVQVDLGTAQSADRVVLQLPALWGARTETLTLSGSADGTTFTTVVAAANYTFDPAANGDTATISFPAGTKRFWRVTITANTGWPAGQISEFQVWNQ